MRELSIRARTLSDPFVFPIIRAHDQNQVISCRIIEVKEIGYEVKQPQAAGKDDQLILRA